MEFLNSKIFKIRISKKSLGFLPCHSLLSMLIYLNILWIFMHELKSLYVFKFISHETVHNTCFLSYVDIICILNYERWIYENMHVFSLWNWCILILRFFNLKIWWILWIITQESLWMNISIHSMKIYQKSWMKSRFPLNAFQDTFLY